ncbi:DUF2752 domain-containing protein [Streptomyces sp. NBC_01808]|uniref:DUF2752 domain-containing protein n=1 Tax=Streptomyces sp. NBC_01808 TaxID=2975947 RepID=UPI002DDB6AFE|nr:DUF2752 domain-containing protein [Streptomyces sp. NBC_01808]WSA37223.1 DUF2752 domain-containing protein [Streptomyces sp. NBC_01808]
MSARTAATAPLRRLAPPLAALACAAAGLAAVGAADPNEPGRYPPCPVLAYTGLACPGCGGLRCAYALAHGDPAAALGANALAAAGAAVLAVALLGWLLAAVHPRPRALLRIRIPARLPVGSVLFALVAAFTLLRNLPFGAVLGP